MTFAGRLVLGTVVVIVAVIIALVAGAELSLRRNLEQDIRGTLEREARLITRVLPPDSAAWQPLVERIGRETGLRITLIAIDGTVVAESDEPAETVPRIENHRSRPEIVVALEG
jgi:two-component system phosphate regulon sensor histidine kinase PhoR